MRSPHLALALLFALLLSSSVGAQEEGGPICGWFTVPQPGNEGLLFPGEAPPWIDETAPCSCCPGGKFGLATYNNPPGSPSLVFTSLGTGSFPALGGTLMLDPLLIIGEPITLNPSPENPTFAAICWEVDDCISIPDNPLLIGVTVYFQAIGVNPEPPGNLILSNRQELLIGTLF